jgi:hypothetical protein
MHTHSKELVPAMTATAVAIVGLAMLFFTEFAPKNEPAPTGISMISTAVIEKAGATVFPTEPAVTRALQKYARNAQGVNGQEPEDDRRVAR